MKTNRHTRCGKKYLPRERNKTGGNNMFKYIVVGCVFVGLFAGFYSGYKEVEKLKLAFYMGVE